jgi:hypothetical protein
MPDYAGSKKYLYLYSGAFILFFILGAIMMQSLQSSLQGTTMTLGIDLYPRWVGVRAVLNGNSPYTLETQRQIWLSIYGSTDVPNGNPFGFYYPPAIVTLMAPFVFFGLSDTTAAMLWCAFVWALLSTSLFIWVVNLRNFLNRPLIILLLLISGWFFRPAFSNYLLGQFALFSVLMAIAGWYFFETDKPILAGIFSALSLVKPSLTILPVVLFFLIYRHKTKGLWSFLISMLILYLPPTIILGWWLPDFLHDISKYALENSVAWSFNDIKTPSGLLWLVSSILLIWFGIRLKDKILILSSALALNVIFVPHTADYDLVAFIPLIVYLSYSWLLAEQKKTRLSIFYFILLWLPWFSLISMLIFQHGPVNTVETWYRLIWLTYPNIILISVLLTKFPAIKSTLKE